MLTLAAKYNINVDSGVGLNTFELFQNFHNFFMATELQVFVLV